MTATDPDQPGQRVGFLCVATGNGQNRLSRFGRGVGLWISAGFLSQGGIYAAFPETKKGQLALTL